MTRAVTTSMATHLTAATSTKKSRRSPTNCISVSVKWPVSVRWRTVRFTLLGNRVYPAQAKQERHRGRGSIAAATWRWLCAIKRLLYDEGYTIAGARQAIQVESRSKRRLASQSCPLPEQQQSAVQQTRSAGCTRCAKSCARSSASWQHADTPDCPLPSKNGLRTPHRLLSQGLFEL